MKKLIFISLFWIIFSNAGFTQNAFYDSQFLTTISSTNLNNIITLANLKNTNLYLSDSEIKVINNFQAFLINPFNDSLSGLDIALLNSSILKYNKCIEFEKQKLLSGAGPSPYFALAGAVAPALSQIPSFIGGNSSSNQDLQTEIIDGLVKYYGEEFQK